MFIRKRIIILKIAAYILLFLLFCATFILLAVFFKTIWWKIILGFYSILVGLFLFSVSFITIKNELSEIESLEKAFKRGDMLEVTMGKGNYVIEVIIPRCGLLYSIPERYRFLQVEEWKKMTEFLLETKVPNTCIKLVYRYSGNVVRKDVFDSYARYAGIPVFM